MNVSKAKRPVNRNIHILQLMKYRLPIPGIVSILHRISGVVLFLMLPLLLCLLQVSFSQEGYHPNGLVKLILLGLLWAYVHHFCAGIRYLLLDLHVGIELPAARSSAKAVMVVSLLITVALAARIFC